MRIGIYGGSFDPIHVGHLMIAEAAREQLRLDRVIFLPAAQSPLKQELNPTDAKARVEMLRLAIGGHPQFVIDDREIDRGGVSYTIDTLREMTVIEKHDWFFIIGADNLADFSRWKSPEVILKLVSLAIVARGGLPPLDWTVLKPYATAEAILDIQKNQIKMPEIEISSREIRERLRRGQSIKYLVAPAVEAYIQSKQLYR